MRGNPLSRSSLLSSATFADTESSASKDALWLTTGASPAQHVCVAILYSFRYPLHSRRSRTKALLALSVILFCRVTGLEHLLLDLHSGSIRVYLHPTMEAPQNAEITVPGSTPFGVPDTNPQVS